MISYLDKNLEVLKAKGLDLTGLLDKPVETFGSYKMELTQNGGATFSAQSNGEWQRLTSKYNPTKEAISQVQKQWQENCDLYIIFGIGGFYHIEETLRRIDTKSKLIVIGQDTGLFQMVLTSRDLVQTLSDDRLSFIIGEDVERVSNHLEFEFKKDVFYLPKICVIEHPVECKLAFAYYNMAQQLLVNVYRGALADMGTRIRFGDQWVRNILGNLPDILQAGDLKKLYNAFFGKPAILVAAGPSLNKNIQLLKEIGDRALIVCVDTAYKSLYQQGITPHLLVAVDGGESNSYDFQGVEYSNIPLIMEMTAHEAIAVNHKGQKMMLHSIRDLTPWLEKVIGEPLNPTYMSTGGSVSCTAFSVMEYLGCDPIIFIGQDLSYPGGKAYANGAVNEQLNIEHIQQDRKLIPLQDIYGQPVYTTDDYLIYLRWFEEKCRIGNRLYINATEGGALCANVEIMRLHDVMDRYCNEQLPIAQILSQANTRTVSPNLYTRIIRKMQQTMVQIRHLIDDLKVMSSSTKQLILHVEQDNISPIQVNEWMGAINQSQQKILKYQFALLFTDAISFREILHDINAERAQNTETFTEKEKNIAACRQILMFSSTLQQVGLHALSILETYLKKLCERIDELNEG